MNLEIPMKEAAVGAGALVTMAQAQVGPVDVVTLQGLVQGLGVPGVVIGVLIWIIREERARNDAREAAFLKALKELSDGVKESGSSMSAALEKLTNTAAALDRKMNAVLARTRTKRGDDE